MAVRTIASGESLSPEDEQHVRHVVDAVCAELGLSQREIARRTAVAERVEAAFRRGCSQPLYLVNAGLSETRPPSVCA